MFGILVFLFTVVPAVEIFLLFKVGGQIGGFNTFLIVILTGIVGASLAKTQGLSILMKIQEKTSQGELPGDQIIQGLMVFAGGLLLLTPGFATDILGFSLVMPGTRHLLLIWVRKMVEKAMVNGKFQFKTFNAGSSSGGFYSYTSTSSHSQHNPFEEFSTKGDTQIEGDTIEAEYTVKK